MSPDEVLAYWFGELRDGQTVTNRSALWFGADPDQDAEVARRFGDALAVPGPARSTAGKATPRVSWH